MKIEERALGERLTPETKAMIRTVFERTLERVSEHIDRVRVRVLSDRDGVLCRARLWPSKGRTLVVSERRGSMLEATYASAKGLGAAIHRRLDADGATARSAPVTDADADSARGIVPGALS